MGFEDKSLQCADCGATFTFSADEQTFFQQKGYTNDPKRCPTCRQARKARLGGTSPNATPVRQMFPAMCSACGKDTEVPFEPREGRPVYCRECFAKTKVAR